REEDIGDRAAYEALVARDGVRRIRMDRLDGAATREMLRGLLDVDDELSGFLAARSEGNPLFASQLLRELVQADALERREGRYRLSKTFDLARVPGDVAAIWERRIARVTAGDPRAR